MYYYLIIALGVLVAGVILAVALGLFNYAQDGEKHRRASNRMMQWRVGLQFGAVIVAIIIVLLAKAG